MLFRSVCVCVCAGVHVHTLPRNTHPQKHFTYQIPGNALMTPYFPSTLPALPLSCSTRGPSLKESHSLGGCVNSNTNRPRVYVHFKRGGRCVFVYVCMFRESATPSKRWCTHTHREQGSEGRAGSERQVHVHVCAHMESVWAHK